MQSTSIAALAKVSDYFKVLSEVSRLLVLCTLKSGTKNVSEIVEATGLGQANVSKHLKILTQAGFIQRTPQGVSVYYEISDPVVFQLCELVCDRLSVHLEAQAQHSEHLKTFQQSI
ncbi:transcriptional regulator [Leptolyngbya valderiana BDU 20041]|uniref:ArsR/SmtB family transcription factor n=1 Tax=Baaleninema simplex TaxID=2862350 RepID=UPI00034CCEB8|nr:metalloregulator ArsR/SmtB family transcription factor [Baaleninema simplex]MDC0835457.1 metalloregulator ArsR/SmtB family transcription factor [Geitlerinema sp. CS-897]OAB55953.1 transcriptional regulator [Leptolyngbya valderiana BDU 20041]PPT11084.1 transcriptional regulator [Geitlerinema sp. FC II]